MTKTMLEKFQPRKMEGKTCCNGLWTDKSGIVKNL